MRVIVFLILMVMILPSVLKGDIRYIVAVIYLMTFVVIFLKKFFSIRLRGKKIPP